MHKIGIGLLSEPVFWIQLVLCSKSVTFSCVCFSFRRPFVSITSESSKPIEKVYSDAVVNFLIRLACQVNDNSSTPHRRFPGRAALTALHGATEDRSQTWRVAEQRAETQLSGQALPLSSKEAQDFTHCMLEIYSTVQDYFPVGIFRNVLE